MLIADAARAPILASIPLLHAAGVLSFGLLLGIVALLGCFMPPYFASQRTILPELVGEDETRMSQANSAIEGGSALRRARRPRPRGRADPVHRGVERAVRRRGDLPRRVPPRPGVRAAAEAGGGGGPARRPGRAALPPSATRSSRRWPRRSSSSGSWRRACPRACRCTRSTRSTAARGSPGCSTRRSAPARSSGASSRSWSWKRFPPLRLAGVRRPRLLDPAVGASVPAAVAGRLRRAVPGDVLHAARSTGRRSRC